ncbi:hypothetical protein DFJ74DRAFT_686258 [Hyaloraphidium curvatum]|nr:hypothetical protein DFJ74DRAFT_686258 [Hyaloraphidium curvatum]
MSLASVEAEARALGIEWAPLVAVSFADFERRKNEIAEELLQGVTTAGFFYVTDHGIPQEEVDRMYGLAKKAHIEVSQEEHVRFKTSAATDGNYAGYVGADDGSSVAAYYNLAKPGSGLEKRLPPVLERELPSLDDFHQKVLDINDRILRVLALGLKLPEDYFLKLHGRRTVSGSHLRLMWYPVRDATKDDEVGNVRVQGHSDFGSLTIMFAPPPWSRSRSWTTATMPSGATSSPSPAL